MQSPLLSGILFTLALSLLRCVGDGGPNSATPLPTKPAVAPQTNDARVAVTGLRRWYFLPTAVTEPWSRMAFTLVKSGPLREMDVWVDSSFVRRSQWTGDSASVGFDDPARLGTGAHTLVLAEAGRDTGFFSDIFFVSAPYCITVSNDWDIPSSGESFDSNLVLGDRLHALHPALVMTHFAGPYAFTDTTIPTSRKQWLAGWLTEANRSPSDEIGLHIHP